MKLALVGRTFVVVSGANERTLSKRLLALGAIAPGEAHRIRVRSASGSTARACCPRLAFALVALYVIAFFKGAAWAGGAAGSAAAEPIAEFELRNRLLAIDTANVPISVESAGDHRLVATWRFADARWLDLARARRMKYVQRVILDFDPESHVVRVMEQMTRFDAAAGPSAAEIEWRTMRGITFFQVEQGSVFGLQFDETGRPQPSLGYEWRFDAREMKTPLIDVTTRAGWQWRPTLWSGPTWLRWLTG